MADLKQMIDELAKLADTAATVLPAAGIAGGAARIGSKLIDIIDDLRHHAPDGQSTDQLEAAHNALVAAITKKSQDTSKALRGE